MLFAMAALSLSLVAGSAADITGKWEGKVSGVRSDGSKNEDTALLIMKQKDTTITGTIGGSETDQHPITSGTIEGNRVTIQAKHATNDREFRLELTVEGDEIKGTLMSGERKADLVAKKPTE